MPHAAAMVERDAFSNLNLDPSTTDGGRGFNQYASVTVSATLVTTAAAKLQHASKPVRREMRFLYEIRNYNRQGHRNSNGKNQRAFGETEVRSGHPVRPAWD